VLAGYLPVLSLKGGGAQGSKEKWLLRKSLIVFQFAISLVFIIVSLLMGNQIRYMLETDYGFKSDAIVSVGTSYGMFDTTGTIKVLEQEIRRLPGITEVTRESKAPIDWAMTTMIVERKGKKDITLGMNMYYGNEEYIPFYGMRIVAGRNIRPGDTLTEWVINETAARGLGFGRPADAVGQMLYSNDNAIPIVGVVADFHQGSLKYAVQPVLIGHVPGFEHFLGVKLASAGKSPENVKQTLTAMEKAFKDVYPHGRFMYTFLDETIANLYETEQKTAALVRAVMVLAIFISCLGLFGLALFTARRKAAEISIRKVLGATTADIATLLNKGFMGLVLLSLLIASPVAWWLTDRWLRDFAYRTPIAWWVFPLAGAAATLIALITVSFQSIRAAMANPVSNLRSE
jgi:putative ABC transport system permease protein